MSFKLETDEAILETKMRTSLSKYGSDLVIGNLLQSRYKEIYLGFTVSQEGAEDLVVVQRVGKSVKSEVIEEDVAHILLKLFRKGGL